VTATLRSEWIKLRTVRVHAVLLILAVAFPLVVVTLVALFGDDVDTVRSSELAELISGTSLISAMLLASIVAIGLTGEFTHGTIRPTFAATPRRTTVVVAKLIVGSAVAAVVATLVVAVCWAVGSLVIDGRDGDVSLGLDDGSFGALAAAVVLAVLLAWFGTGIGLIVRNAPATVSLLLLWPLVAEGLLAGLMTALGAGGLTRWLPYQSVIAVLAATPSDDALGRPEAWLWFGSVSAVLVLVGTVLTRRRDA
jgi:ABC-2 type transport system permease protein